MAYLKLFLTLASILLKKVIAICYIDDLIFWAINEKDIFDLAVKLHAERVDLEQEDDAAEFLGVHIECIRNQISQYDAEKSDQISVGNSWP